MKILNWERLKYFNDYSILSFQDSGSYVPMLEYNYLEKFFAFFFRPLFFDATQVYSWTLSIENAILLMLHLVVGYLIVRYWETVKTDRIFKIIIIYTFISGLLYVQRYAGLGIFVRTKVMIQPFTILALLYIAKFIAVNSTIATNKSWKFLKQY